MCVLPEQERAAALHVDEPQRGAPRGDLGAPSNGDPEQPQPVAEASADCELVRCLDDPEAQPGRRDPLEVAGLAEERESLLDRDGNDLGALERVLANAAETATRAPHKSSRWRGRSKGCARHDSNMRPLPPQGSALSPELRARRGEV